MVNFASEKVTLTYDPAVAQPQEVIDRIHRAGYEVPTATGRIADLIGMTCANCAANVERALEQGRRRPGSQRQLRQRKGHGEYVVGTTGRASLVAAVRKAGYDVVEAGTLT